MAGWRFSGDFWCGAVMNSLAIHFRSSGEPIDDPSYSRKVTQMRSDLQAHKKSRARVTEDTASAACTDRAILTVCVCYDRPR